MCRDLLCRKLSTSKHSMDQRTARPSLALYCVQILSLLQLVLNSLSLSFQYYSIVTAFSIEPTSDLFGDDSPNRAVVRPIRGIMTTYGYVLPDPSTPNRLSVWFTGGTVEVDDEGDAKEWRRIFGDDDATTDASQGGPMAPPRPGPSLSERAKLLAAKLLLGATVPQGMEEDGSMNFKLRRPVGGHGSAYVDMLYLDDTLRIMQGHHGSVYVMARVPGS